MSTLLTPRATVHAPRTGALLARVRRAVDTCGKKQRHIALAMGLDETKLSKSLSGTRRFTLDELAALAAATGTSLEELLEDPTPSASASSTATTPAPLVSTEPQHVSKAERVKTLHATRRHTILASAWDAFASYGYAPVRVSDIAREAGMSTASVHYYFPSKSDIFLATLQLCTQRAQARRQSLLSLEDPTRRLVDLLVSQLPCTEEISKEWSIWAQFWSAAPLFPEARKVHEAMYQQWLQVLLTTIEQGQQAGVFSTDVSAQQLVDMVASLFDGLGLRMMSSAFPHTEAAQLLENFVTTCVQLCPHTGPHPATQLWRDHQPWS